MSRIWLIINWQTNAEKPNSHLKKQRTDTYVKMIKTLELSDNNYNAAIINVLKEVRVNTLEANVKKVKQKN